MSDPDVLILDEPTLGLDVRVASTLESIITGLAKSGKAILFSTHEVETAERLCDRLLLVSQGVIAFDGTVHSLRSTLNIARYEVTITDDELRDSVEHALRTHIPGLAVEQAEDSTFVIDTHGSVSLNAVVTAMMDRGIPFTAIRKSSVPIRKIVARILPEGEVALAPVKDEAAGAKPARRPLVPMTWDRTARQTMVLIPLEISLGFRMMRRYPLNTISSLIMLSLVFLGMVVGAGFLTGGGLSSLRLTTAVAGFAVWVTVLDGFSQFALGISQEAVRGTLEKLFQSVIPAQAILFARGIANVLPSLLSLSIFTIGLMLVSGSPLSLSPLMPITLGLALFASYGIGLALGGLALVAKRVDQLVSLLQFAVLPLLFIDPGTVSAAPVRETLRFIPFSLATRLMSRLASGLGVALVEMLTLTVTSLALFAIGIACFKRATRVVKARGTLGHQ
jgi:ABC-2 type transport system permease protein